MALQEDAEARVWLRICGFGIRPFRTFSAYPTPPWGHILILFKAYLDDSGAPTGGHGFLTVAGYAADVGGWEHFEKLWAYALRDAGVPYLHMKEFGNRNSTIYAHLKADKVKEADFMESLIDIIYESVGFCAQTTVVLDDMKEFNRSHGVKIDPYALGIYGCLLELRREYMFDASFGGSEVIVDSFDKAQFRTDKALAYLTGDAENPTPFQVLSVRPLNPCESAKTILPLQAADLIAWEMRKLCEDHREWDLAAGDRSSFRTIVDSYERFATDYRERSGRRPRVRRSLWGLRESPVLAPHGMIIDRERLEALHARHPNGWA